VRIIIKPYTAPEKQLLLALNRGFLAIAMLTLLLGSVYIALIGFFFAGWGAQYRYELFYFPSPVTYTLDSLTSTGRMVSIVLPILAVSSLLLSALAIRIPSAKMISTEQHRPQASLPGAPKLKQLPTGTFAVSTPGDANLDAAAPALQASVKHDYLYRLFPYEPKGVALGCGRVNINLAIEPGKSQTRAACDLSSMLLTTT
jgi:hypothetical protein